MSETTATVFGKYQLLERIAAGGMAEIFRARFTGAAGVTKNVVIKKILPHYAGNKAFVSMFVNEAKIAVGLSHGNIAQVFDFGEIEGEFFLAMEYVHGQPLSKVIKRARAVGIQVMPTPFAVLIAMEVCKGLHYAHTRLDDQQRPMNIIHRDVSPQNVIISYEGQVKLVDFGIAKARNASNSETEAGALKGKYTYFAPEQARGKDLDARTDIFATGTVLYEMLCGRLPFEGKMIEVLSKIVRADFVPPHDVNPELSPALESVLLTAMAHEKDDRYATAEAFLEALSHYLYSSAPTFSTSSLAQLMQYLFEQELVAEGLPVRLPREFLEQVPLWVRALPAPGKMATPEPATVYAKGQSGRLPRVTNPPAPQPMDGTEPVVSVVSVTQSQAMSALHRRSLRWLLVGAPLFAGLLAMVVVFGVGYFGQFAIQLESTPPGAIVTVDGQELGGRTPLLVGELSALHSHRIELTAPGMKRWVRELSPAYGATVTLRAELEPDRPPADLANPAARPSPTGEKPTAGAAPPVPTSVAYPVANVRVAAAHHGFAVPPTRAARIRLDPRKAYRVWTEGRLSLSGAPEAQLQSEVVYLAQGDDSLPSRDGFGLLSPRGRILRGASALYAFVLDGELSDNSGAIRVRIQEKSGGPVSTLLVDAREHALALEPEQMLTLTGLDPAGAYEVVLSEGVTPARTREGKLGRPGQVLLVQLARPTAAKPKAWAVTGTRIVEVGRRYRFAGAASVAFAFPDDGLDDNDGGLEVELAPAAGETPSGRR